MPFSNGTLISDDGEVAINEVANTYVPIAGDIYLRGTLHASDGTMYVTTGANQGSDVLINGVRHTTNGVRVTGDAVQANSWPEGFTVGDDGRQGTIGAIQTNFIRGIGRSSDGRMSIDAGSVPAGNIALAANIFENVQSFGTDQGVVGVRLTPGGVYQWVAEPDTLNPGAFWQDNNFGTEWIDDGGASAAQFEAQITILNGGSLLNPTYVGWSGAGEWLPITQNLEFYDFNDAPATSSNGGIMQVEVREITTPANIVSGTWEGHADNEP